MAEEITFDKAVDIAAKRAEEWFKVHADQRLRLFNFYVILVGASVAGFVSALAAEIYPFALVIAGLLAIATLAFKRLDRRVAELVKVAEGAHDFIDQLVSAKLQAPALRIAELSDKKVGTKSYRQSFNVIFTSGAAISVVGAVIAIVSWSKLLPT